MSDPLNITGELICNTGYAFGDLFALASGYIYNVTNVDNKLQILGKLVKIKKERHFTDFKKEYDLANIASNNNVGPMLYGIYRCKYNGIEYGIILIEKVGTTDLTHAYADDNMRAHVLNLTYNAWNKMYDNNVEYFPEHSDNILYDKNKDEIYLIDFGSSNMTNAPIPKIKRKYELDVLNPDTYVNTWITIRSDNSPIDIFNEIKEIEKSQKLNPNAKVFVPNKTMKSNTSLQTPNVKAVGGRISRSITKKRKEPKRNSTKSRKSKKNKKRKLNKTKR
tara:strand:+ start:414 stop:1247 length:834 start_codon:yes stop_codon:yes gene_type:complete